MLVHVPGRNSNLTGLAGQAEEQRTQGVKLAEHGASIGMLRMDMDRTRDMAGNTDRQLQTTKREQAEVQLVVEGLQG